MDFLLSPELRDFQTSLRKVFSAEGIQVGRNLALKSENQSVSVTTDLLYANAWRAVVELGIFAAGVEVEFEGLGFGQTAHVLIAEEAGRELPRIPLFETLAYGILPISVLATQKAKRQYLPRLAEGLLKVSGSFDFLPENFFATKSQADFAKILPLRAEPLNSSSPIEHTHSVFGVLELIPHFSQIDSIVAIAREGEDTKLFLISLKGQPPDTLKPESVGFFDSTRSFAIISLQGARAVLLSDALSTKDLLRLFELNALLAAGELAGIGRKVVEMTVEYCSTRKQFGQAVAKFQAVQHALADSLLRVEEISSLVRSAAWAVDSGEASAKELILSAKGYAGEQIPVLIEKAIQLHGGIGFTFEFPLHLYLRRARYLQQSLGRPSEAFEILGLNRLAGEEKR